VHIVLPIGISFYTFTQIAFLVDCWQGKVHERSFIHYLLFVTYFPHLIAGPVLHHAQMMPQFANPRHLPARPEQGGDRHRDLRLRPRQETPDRRPSGPVRRHDVQRRAQGHRAHAVHRVVRRAGLHAADLFRLLGLFGHGGGPVAVPGRAVAAQLPLALQVDQHHRVLAPLAHLAVDFLRDYLYVPLGGNRKGPAGAT
jgi:alginate O-acetyltransferase complex protein AlgI